MPKIKTTKQEAIEMFNEIKPEIEAKFGKKDRIAMAEAWSSFTDGLCKDGIISEHQYKVWSNPF